MAMVMFLVLSGEPESPLQKKLRLVETRFFRQEKKLMVRPDDDDRDNAIDELDKKRRLKLRKQFTEENLLEDVAFPISQNPNLSMERDYPVLFELYQWTIGAWAAQRASAARVVTIATRLAMNYE
jgi:hypothetical protein